MDVVGVPASGWDGLGEAERGIIASAEVLLGGRRHLDLVPETPGQSRIPWPSPLHPGLAEVLGAHAGSRVVALASGDPLMAGIGSTLVDLLGAENVRVHPAVSSVALARARMRWPAESVVVVRLVDPGASRLRAHLAPGRRIVVLSRDETSPADVASALVDAGFGDSRMTVWCDLGSVAEQSWSDTATCWRQAEVSRLNLVCVECVPAAASPTWSPAPGLPDEAYEHDGQLSKRLVRAAALAHLRPAPGELLWDLGAGAGSIAIEWARMDASCRAVAVERDPARAERIRRNADRLGVSDVAVHVGEMADVAASLPSPDAVFIGGGVTCDLILAVWDVLHPGGRLVAHAVTVESEMILVAAWQRLGGDLTRMHLEHLEPLGGLHGWRPARPVVQWSLVKPLPGERT